MIKRWYYRLFYRKYCTQMAMYRSMTSNDVVYLRMGWWFDRGKYERNRNWKKSPANPVNHDCYLNGQEVRLSGCTYSPALPSIIDDPIEYYYICKICGKRLKDRSHDKS